MPTVAENTERQKVDQNICSLSILMKFSRSSGSGPVIPKAINEFFQYIAKRMYTVGTASIKGSKQVTSRLCFSSSMWYLSWSFQRVMRSFTTWYCGHNCSRSKGRVISLLRPVFSVVHQ